MNQVSQLMDKLLSESKKIKKTLGTSKRLRTKKTSLRLMSDKIDKASEREIRSALVRHHIRANIQHRFCGNCKQEQIIVSKMQVISQTKSGEERITANVTAYGMYQFHHDLPIITNHYDEFIPVCLDCLCKDKNERSLDET